MYGKRTEEGISECVARLQAFGAGRRAEVRDDVFRLRAKQQRREAAHELLALQRADLLRRGENDRAASTRARG